MLELMDVETVIPRISGVLLDVSGVSKDGGLGGGKFYMNNSICGNSSSSIFGRVQLVHYSVSLLVSWLFSAPCDANKLTPVHDALFSTTPLTVWLRNLLLEDFDPSVRRELCTGLYKMCLGSTTSGRTGLLCTTPLLSVLLELLDDALAIKPMNRYSSSGMGNDISNHNLYSGFLHSSNSNDDPKEVFGPACRDYFWNLCRLVDNLGQVNVQIAVDEEYVNDPNNAPYNPKKNISLYNTVDLDNLCRRLVMGLVNRKLYEKRHVPENQQGGSDDMLVGSLNLLCCVMKHQPSFKSSPEGQAFLVHLLDYLFALPNPREKNYPKCKSMVSRTACYDLIVEMAKGCLANYTILHERLLEQHSSDAHKPYPWEYWPKDDGRSDCGYVGLTNLGATCYMASCMQQLYMIPQARSCILSSDAASAPDGKHLLTLQELQKMFAYLLDSERKAYNPLSFCKTYQMDHALLNTGEQKDMAEFFIDLLSKMEEMGPDLKSVVKELFCGTQTNNVVSLDCCHVSRTAEEFYTVRCQVAEMRNLYQSLEEVTVKDTLEGDNMYTCSQCNKKVRAEKRACFKQLPKILAFNTMRYTFNMITMLKEKVNTHFSFPFRLDMSPYMEHNLIPNDKQEMASASDACAADPVASSSKINDIVTKADSVSNQMTYMEQSSRNNSGDKNSENVNEVKSQQSKKFNASYTKPSYEYELIGVTVHTGTADGGHYYAFIRDRTVHTNNAAEGTKSNVSNSGDKWYSFNDAEVKQFDPSQIAAECFGGEMNSRTYDQGTDKFMDLSIEKTNSAYMLFYERVSYRDVNEPGPSSSYCSSSETITTGEKNTSKLDGREDDTQIMKKDRDSFNLSQDLEEWIWKDNMNFIQDNNIFDHTYFNFMWQMVGYIPTTLNPHQRLKSVSAASTSAEHSLSKDEVKNKPDANNDDITLLSAKLATSFFLESFIHAKEKLNIVQWVELLTKQFDSSTAACAWLLNHMADDNNWPVTIFLKCQVATIRQMFHRLCIHVIQKLRPMEKDKYYLPWSNKGPHKYPDKETAKNMGTVSPISKFIKMLLTLLESGVAKAHLKHLTELFRFLFDFAKLGDEEAQFLLTTRTISIFVDFYLKAIKQSPDNVNVDVVSDDEEDEDDDIMTLTPISESKKLASLEKMVNLIATLVEKSRMDDNRIHLARDDVVALAGHGHGDGSGEGSSSSNVGSGPFISTGGGSRSTLIFLFNITKDNINMCQTCNLIFSLTRNNHVLAEQVAAMVFHGVKQPEVSMHFFRLLTLLTEFSGGPSGQPCYTTLVMHKVWELAKTCPQAALDWLSIQANRNRYVQNWLVSTMETWIEQYLIGHQNQKVRNSAAFLVVSLVPSAHFRQAFRSARGVPSPVRDSLLSRGEETECLHKILEFLYGLLQNARQYTDLQQHGSGKLVAYFQTMTHFLLTRTEKLMFGTHFGSLWQLFHPKLSEPSIPVHHNKQALLSFWYNVCVDCPENIQLILQNPQVIKNIAFNYILADHEDTDVVNFNRMMLPTYYGLLRMCCTQSRSFTRQLAQHQNLQWAFKNITPYTTQYTLACEELFKLMSLFVQKGSEQQDHATSNQDRLSTTSTRGSGADSILGPAAASSAPPSPDGAATDQMSIEEKDVPKSQQDKNIERAQEIRSFRQQALQLYLTTLDGRSSWSTLINALKILIEGNEDRLFVVYNNGLALLFESFNMLHMMFHEATACHVTEELVDLCTIYLDLIKAVRMQRNNSEITQILSRWKDMGDMANRLLTLVNSFTPPELREVSLSAIKEMLMLWPPEMLNILVPLLHRAHSHASDAEAIGLGQYFPRRHNVSTPNMKAARPPRPILQMFVPSNQLEAHHGQDSDYDRSLHRYFLQYHGLIDLMVRLSVNEDNLSKMLVDLSSMVGLDGVPLHFQLFPKLWIDIYNTQQIDRKFIQMLIQSHGFLEYVDAVLLDERSSLNNQYIFNFLYTFFPKVASQVLTDQVLSIINQLVRNFIDIAGAFNLTRANHVRHLNGDLRALLLVSTTRTDHLTSELLKALRILRLRVERISDILREKEEAEERKALEQQKVHDESDSEKRDSISSPEEQPKVKSDVMSIKGETVPEKKPETPLNEENEIATQINPALYEGEKGKDIPKHIIASTSGESSSMNQRKRKSDDSIANLQSGESMRKIPKHSPEQQKDPDTTRLRETLATFAKTLTLLTQLCDRASSGQPEFCSAQPNTRTSRALSSTLAVAVRVATALSASSAVRQKVSPNKSPENPPNMSSSREISIPTDYRDNEVDVATSTPKKVANLEVIKVSSPISTDVESAGLATPNTKKCDNEDIHSQKERRSTRKSSQSK